MTDVPRDLAVAVHPVDPSEDLVEAFADAGIELRPVEDVLALTDAEPAGGWDLLVVDIDADPVGRLALARRAGETTAIPVLIVVSGRHLRELAGFEAADFIVSPVGPAELAIRVERLVATGPDSDLTEILTFKDLTLDLATYQASVGGHPVDLTFMEYELLRFFVANQGRVWSRDQLLSKVWGYDYFGGARTVDVHVRRLRAKLGEERASWITTVRSVGYRFG